MANSGNLLVALVALGGVIRATSDFANTTVREQIATENAPAGYFPSFIVEERSNPLGSWPKGKAWSRRQVAKLTRQRMAEGVALTLFYHERCPMCAQVLEVFDELGIPCSSIDYGSLVDIAEDEDGARLGDVVREELYSLDVSHDEPFVFLGTR